MSVRGLGIFLALFTSSAYAEGRTVEVCRPGSALIRQINEGRADEYLINARHYLREGGYPIQTARREALAELLGDAGVVLNATDGGGGPYYNVLDEVDHDGAVLERAVGATMHDCINVRTGDYAWRRLLDAGVVDR